ncbi:MAG TPA: hypothetical protein VMU25_03845 [Candidatus Paceibacterota bacterium]|nr:hypothetical protein [Candidatus Paceibacterota bacterium]
MRTIRSGFIAFFVLAVCAFGIWYLRRTPQETQVIQNSLNGISSCFKENTDKVLCTQPYVASLLKIKNSSEVMDILSQRFNPTLCHLVGHVVGQQTYLKYQNVDAAMRACNRQCSDACTHGIVGEAFAQQLGNPDPNVDLEHLSVDAIEKVGGALCQSPNTCHGVGHVLFQEFKQFKPALSLCDTIATSTKSYCYGGVYMEYSDIISETSMRAVSGVAYPEPGDLQTLCSSQDTVGERRACFFYFPNIVITTLMKQGTTFADASQRLQDICASYAQGSDSRGSCFTGIGLYYSYLLTSDPQRARQACEFPNLADQAACNIGVISIDIDANLHPAYSYCSSLATDPLRSSCYQSAFNLLSNSDTWHQDQTIPEKFCGTDESCVAQAKNYALDPWKEIAQTFSAH